LPPTNDDNVGINSAFDVFSPFVCAVAREEAAAEGAPPVTNEADAADDDKVFPRTDERFPAAFAAIDSFVVVRRGPLPEGEVYTTLKKGGN